MKRPNILLLYTDQQRHDALGVNGNDDIQTPHLDRMAAEGVNFDHYFVQNPVCMPSRLSFLSGQYPSTLGITHMGDSSLKIRPYCRTTCAITAIEAPILASSTFSPTPAATTARSIPRMALTT